MDSLPPEVLLEVCRYLQPKSIWQFRQTCSRIYSLVCPLIWAQVKFKLGPREMYMEPPRFHNKEAPIYTYEPDKHYVIYPVRDIANRILLIPTFRQRLEYVTSIEIDMIGGLEGQTGGLVKEVLGGYLPAMPNIRRMRIVTDVVDEWIVQLLEATFETQVDIDLYVRQEIEHHSSLGNLEGKVFTNVTGLYLSVCIDYGDTFDALLRAFTGRVPNLRSIDLSCSPEVHSSIAEEVLSEFVSKVTHLDTLRVHIGVQGTDYKWVPSDLKELVITEKPWSPMGFVRPRSRHDLGPFEQHGRWDEPHAQRVYERIRQNPNGPPPSPIEEGAERKRISVNKLMVDPRLAEYIEFRDVEDLCAIERVEFAIPGHRDYNGAMAQLLSDCSETLVRLEQRSGRLEKAVSVANLYCPSGVKQLVITQSPGFWRYSGIDLNFDNAATSLKCLESLYLEITYSSFSQSPADLFRMISTYAMYCPSLKEFYLVIRDVGRGNVPIYDEYLKLVEPSVIVPVDTLRPRLSQFVTSNCRFFKVLLEYLRT